LDAQVRRGGGGGPRLLWAWGGGAEHQKNNQLRQGNFRRLYKRGPRERGCYLRIWRGPGVPDKTDGWGRDGPTIFLASGTMRRGAGGPGGGRCISIQNHAVEMLGLGTRGNLFTQVPPREFSSQRGIAPGPVTPPSWGVPEPGHLAGAVVWHTRGGKAWAPAQRYLRGPGPRRNTKNDGPRGGKLAARRFRGGGPDNRQQRRDGAWGFWGGNPEGGPWESQASRGKNPGGLRALGQGKIVGNHPPTTARAIVWGPRQAFQKKRDARQGGPQAAFDPQRRFWTKRDSGHSGQKESFQPDHLSQFCVHIPRYDRAGLGGTRRNSRGPGLC